jgi:S1-C subfamily serine protease
MEPTAVLFPVLKGQYLRRSYPMRRLYRTARLLAFLLIAITAVPALATAIILTAPDRRAIPMLVSRGRSTSEYGSGVVVGSTTVLTAAHVTPTDKVEVRLLGGPVTGRVVCRDQTEDAAVVTAPLPKGTPYYRLSFRIPAVGETVRVGGYPNRQWRTTRGRITHIISSAILSGRRVTSPMIVFEPAVHQGASGSPVLDAGGRVIGIFIASNPQSNYSIAFPNQASLRACGKYVR